MNRYGIIILSAAMALFLPSCTEEQTAPKEEGIVLSLRTASGEIRTPRTKVGEGRVDWNENRIEDVYYFLYREGRTDTAPVLSGFFAGLDLDGANPTKSWNIPVSSKTVIEDLFPVGTQKCRAFIIANPTPELAAYMQEGSSTLTIDDLHRYSFYSSLSGIQDNFVMTYEGDADLISRTGGSNRVVARIDARLKRLAVKLSMHAKVVPNYVDPITGEWVPEIGGLRASFHNALSKTNLAGDFALLSSVRQSDYFDTEEAGFENTRPLTFRNTSGNMVSGTISDTSIPLYSYPMIWEFADRDEPYLFVELPWTRYWTDIHGNHQSTQSCYYKIMFSLKNVDANQWFDVNITLDALGSFNKVEPSQQYLYEDYMVLDWHEAYNFSQTNVDADIKEARYLVVPTTEFEIHDQTRLSIPFSSSHETSVRVVSVTQENLKTGAQTNLTSSASGWFSFASVGSVLEFNHDLNNSLNASLDVTPYDITIELSHTDDPSYSQEIHIIQYPAITVSKELNSAVTKSGSRYTKNEANGYVYINGSQTATADNNTNEQFAVLGNQYMDANDFGTGTNNCPYIYEIQVQALSDDKYVLNDPRSADSGNLGYSFASAPSMYPGTNRRMTYYYQTGTAADEADNTISPRFKIASSFGKTWNLSYAEAVRRCAAYQEDGYPAGRWRLPTYSEIEFCLSLSNYQLIEVLFGSNTDDSDYWYSTGYATIKRGGTSIDPHPGTGGTTERAVRCVYDSWYWDEVDRDAGRTEADRLARRSTFTWGDQPR